MAEKAYTDDLQGLTDEFHRMHANYCEVRLPDVLKRGKYFAPIRLSVSRFAGPSLNPQNGFARIAGNRYPLSVKASAIREYRPSLREISGITG
ncbi:MAG: hypothetical protein LBL31_04070 [Spirochaetaceae bacterium]|nr:hypothetical protein [Spirochaetaceae bacterium]